MFYFRAVLSHISYAFRKTALAGAEQIHLSRPAKAAFKKKKNNENAFLAKNITILGFCLHPFPQNFSQFLFAFFVHNR